MKALQLIARIFSALFSPILMGTYGIVIALWLSYLCFSPEQAKITVSLVTFATTCVVPVIAIFLLNRLGKVKDPMLNERTERTWPYVVCTICYAATGVYYHSIHAPLWLSLFMISGAMALITLTVVNRWWKISGHATGMGALCGMLLFLSGAGNSIYNLKWIFLLAVLVAGIVCTSRLILNRHTLGQVAAGFANGFLWIYLPAILTQAVTVPAFE